MKENKQKKCVIYVRVSTKLQAEEGYSLDQQMKACEEYALKKGWTILERFREEGESAKNADRKQLGRLIEYCRNKNNKVEVLLVWRIDRFFRNTEDHYVFKNKLKQYGVTLDSASEPVDDSHYGKFMEGIFALLAELENGMKSERVTANMTEALKGGNWMWTPPIGYKKGMIIDEEKAQNIKRLYETYAQGIHTIKQMEKVVAQWGFASVHNKDLGSMAIKRILENRLYTGWIYKEEWGVEVKGNFEPIIDTEIFSKVQLILKAQGYQQSVHVRENEEYPLKETLRCATEGCGSLMRSSPGHNKIKKVYGYYLCKKGRVKDGHVQISTTKAHESFIKLLQSITFPEEDLRLFTAMVTAEYYQQMDEVIKRIKSLDKELEDLRELRSSIFRNLHKNKKADFESEELNKVNEEILQKEGDRDELKMSELDIQEAVDQCIEFFKQPEKLWQLAPYPNKVALQKYLFPEGIFIDKQGNMRTPRYGDIIEGIKRFGDSETHEVLPM